MEGLSPSPRPRDVAHRCRLTGSAARMPGVGAEAAVCLAGVRLLAATGLRAVRPRPLRSAGWVVGRVCAGPRPPLARLSASLRPAGLLRRHAGHGGGCPAERPARPAAGRAVRGAARGAGRQRAAAPGGRERRGRRGQRGRRRPGELPPCPEGVTGGGGSATRVPDPVSRFCSKTTRTLNRFAVRPGRFRPSRPVWGLGLCSQAAGPRLQRAQPCGRGAGARAGLAAASPARGVTEPRLALPRVTASGVTRGI